MGAVPGFGPGVRGSVWFGTLGLVLLLALSGGRAAEEMKLGEFIPATPPQPAPEVAFTDANGKPASLDDFKGKPVVLNLWATWCQPCLKEMPSLDRLQARFANKLRVAAVAEDHGGGKLVNPFVAGLKLKNLTVYLDPQSELGHAFSVRGLPTSIVIDAAGRVRGRVEGEADWDSDAMQDVLRPLLAPDEDGLKKAAR
jgi:thiol-disulfide isomerase/thioredoxin